MIIKVDIYKDKMVLKTEGKSITVKPEEQYYSSRLLVGTFQPAVNCLKKGLEEIGSSGFFSPKPTLTICAKEMADGGLSEIEERCFQELGHTVGAKKVEVTL